MRARKLSLLILLCFCSSLLLSGCWSRREIEDLGFITAAAIDLTEEGLIELTVQLAVTEAMGGEAGGDGPGQEPVWTVTTRGRSIAEAVANLRTFIAREPFWSHARVIIFGEELAQAGLAPVLDYMLRAHDFQLSKWVLVSEGEAKDILDVTPTITQIPADYIEALMISAVETGLVPQRQLFDFMRTLLGEPGTEPLLPMIRPRPQEEQEGLDVGAEGGGNSENGNGEGEGEEEAPEALLVEGAAVFRADRMIGKLTGEEARAMLWLRGDVRRARLFLDVEGQGYIFFTHVFSRRTLQIEADDGELRATISVFVDGDIAEHNLPQREINPEAMAQLDAVLLAEIESNVSQALRQAQQELQSDVLGIGDRVYRLHPELFRERPWEQVFVTLPVDIVVEANFRRTGMLSESPFQNLENLTPGRRSGP